MFKQNQEILDLLKRPNSSVRCWKCLRLVRDESHECFQRAIKFVTRYEGALGGRCGELWSVYPLEENEVEKLGGDLTNV